MSADDLLPMTVSVPEWGGVVYDAAKNLSYDMAKRGEFDVIEIGPGGEKDGKPIKKFKRVPVRPNLHRMAGGDPTVVEELSRDFIAKLKIFRAQAKAKRAVA